MNQEQDQKIILDFQIRRVFAVLSRNMLGLLEILKKNHQINFDKLYDNLPDDCGPIVHMADYFDEKHYQYYRKLFLDRINESKRDLEKSIIPNDIESDKQYEK